MLSVLAVPAFADNYLWLIHDGTHAAVVDPGDAAPIVAALEAHKLSLVAILLTHHHADHAGGVPDLLKRFNSPRFNIPVYGPRHETIAGVSHRLGENDTLTIPELGLHLSVLDVPGHTRGHIAYVAHQQAWLFCGDTLFAGGCGRLFEGTPQDMVRSLAKLTALPEETKVYCAHEYTLSNLRFAQEVEPDNAALRERVLIEKQKRELNEPTVPSTIALEKATNPFLRYREKAIAEKLFKEQRVASMEPIAVFSALRQWKNSYR